MFLKQDARYGPNKPERLPGRKRDRDRAARRAEKTAAGMGMDMDGDVDVGDESEEEELGVGMEVDDDDNAVPTINEFTRLSEQSTPGARPSTSTSPARPTTSASPSRSYDMAISRLNDTPIGRPRTRPVIEITSLQELAHLDIASLPSNIRSTFYISNNHITEAPES